MGTKKLEDIDKLTKGITEALFNNEKIIEGGWQAMFVLTLKGAPAMQVREMRKAFFCGAQHLFASIMTILDPGREPTEADEQRMTAIHNELQEFLKELKQELTT